MTTAVVEVWIRVAHLGLVHVQLVLVHIPLASTVLCYESQYVDRYEFHEANFVACFGTV